MSNLVKRLRDHALLHEELADEEQQQWGADLRTAADRIEALDAEVAAQRAMLERQQTSYERELEIEREADEALLRQALAALESTETAHPRDGGYQRYDEYLVEPAIAALRERLGKSNEQA